MGWSLVYVELEGWRHLDSVYLCVVTLTTVGLGDFEERDRVGEDQAGPGELRAAGEV